MRETSSRTSQQVVCHQSTFFYCLRSTVSKNQQEETNSLLQYGPTLTMKKLSLWQWVRRKWRTFFYEGVSSADGYYQRCVTNAEPFRDNRPLPNQTFAKQTSKQADKQTKPTPTHNNNNSSRRWKEERKKKERVIRVSSFVAAEPPPPPPPIPVLQIFARSISLDVRHLWYHAVTTDYR